MALFGPAFDFILPHEGGYVNDPADPGGETKYGISKRAYPKEAIASLTAARARELYERDWWNKHRFAEIDDQPAANKIFDMAINMGAGKAFWIVQLACESCRQGVSAGEHGPKTGVLGPETIVAVNASAPAALLAAIRVEAAGYYQRLAAARPDLQKFLKGWLRRAAS